MTNTKTTKISLDIHFSKTPGLSNLNLRSMQFGRKIENGSKEHFISTWHTTSRNAQT